MNLRIEFESCRGTVDMKRQLYSLTNPHTPFVNRLRAEVVGALQYCNMRISRSPEAISELNATLIGLIESSKLSKIEQFKLMSKRG